MRVFEPINLKKSETLPIQSQKLKLLNEIRNVTTILMLSS